MSRPVRSSAGAASHGGPTPRSRRCRVDALAPTFGRVVGAECAHVGYEMIDAALGREAVDPLLERRIVGDIEHGALHAGLPAAPLLLALPHQLGVAGAEADGR